MLGHKKRLTQPNSKGDSWVMWLTGLFALAACAVFAFVMIKHKRVTPDVLPPKTSTNRSQTNASATGEFNVVRVHDGDTITLVGADGLEISVRLRGIDAPELGQPYGFEAKQALQELFKTGTVSVSQTKKGKYGRYVADVYLGDSWINQTMVDEGHAWCDQVNSSNRQLYSAEQEAKAQRKGLWALPAPEPPWIWRAERK